MSAATARKIGCLLMPWKATDRDASHVTGNLCRSLCGWTTIRKKAKEKNSKTMKSLIVEIFAKLVKKEFVQGEDLLLFILTPIRLSEEKDIDWS